MINSLIFFSFVTLLGLISSIGEANRKIKKNKELEKAIQENLIEKLQPHKII
tara:strand:+ start:2848 stop:3003 length:156 start_codon:yes stop_codon:yes gene_type:complete